MIKATIYDNKLNVENSSVSDGVRFDTVKFVFPEKWKNYRKTAVFTTESDEQYNLVLDKDNSLCLSENECYIPHEVLKSPCFYLSVFGVSGESIATTPKVKITVLQSGYGEGAEPSDPTPTEYQQITEIVTNAQKIAQSVRDDADNGLFNGEKGDKGDKGDKGEDGGNGGISQEYMNQIFAPALKNSMEDAMALTIDDVSPLKHEVAVKISSKNLIPYPYKITTQTIDGITFTDLGDGTVMINGEAEKEIVFEIQNVQLRKGITYTLSGCPIGGVQYRSYWLSLSSYAIDTGDTVTFTPNFNSDTMPVMICISQGEFCNNLIFNPQLETGNSATSFEPYISDLEGIEVKRTGKNLFSYKRFIEFGNSFDPSWGRIGTYLGKECFIYKNKHSTPTSNQFTFMKGEFLENTQYTISLGATYSFNDIASYSMPVLAFVYTDGTVSSIQTRLYNTEYVNFYSTSKANKTISHILVQNFSSGCTVYIKTNIQLEKGTSATEYEAFAEPQTAKALSDGVVEELTSLSPNMIILSHSKGVKIKAEYNADLKLYIDKRIKELTN